MASAIQELPLTTVSDPAIPDAPKQTLRVMTYNVHACVGSDFKRSEERIARVIESFEPDIVGIQEVDLKRRRSAHVDQAQLIGRILGYQYIFNPALEVRGEQYGDALFSRIPFRTFQAAPLPFGPHFLFKETRGAIGIELLDSKIRIINTHLGLGQAERLAQAKALAGVDWIGACRGPIILMGDLNSMRGSPAFKVLTGRLKDCGKNVARRGRATYPSTFPTISIDHILTTPDFEVERFHVPNDPKTRVASDHLPVVVTLRYDPAHRRVKNQAVEA